MNKTNKPTKTSREKAQVKNKPPKLSLIKPELLEASNPPHPSQLRLPFFRNNGGGMTPRDPRGEDSLSKAFKNFQLN